MAKKQIKELLGLAMVGEGALGLVFPKQYTLFWKLDFEPFKTLKQTAAEKPEIIRLFYAAEIGFGFWLAAKQLKKRNAKK